MKVFFPEINREDVIREVGRCAKKLQEELGLEGAILFGSYAKGNYTVASDIDILIVFDDKKSREEEVYRRLMREIKLPRVELHIISKKDLKVHEWTRWIEVIENEGVRIL
ncbi:MAG: nucleotidyltransferase domain-containing protein [Candidatus Methanomethyliaceae archaeon]|nr:nucleotidyltransferase domain-containing protein [Candidatus Methanomethyliaceae archaeon]